MDTNLQAAVEYDLEGKSTGVELEQPDDLIDEPFDPAQIDVQTRTLTVDLLLSRLRRGVLDIAPDFQRLAGIWDDGNQSRLIESLLLRIPLPTLYAAETGEESWAVVDGIQRLTTIARFVEPEAIGAKPLKLRGLEYLRQYQGFRYHELPGGLQTRINETQLIIHLIRAGTPEPVKFNIFARINTGGRPLTRQELRHALIPGPARALLRDLAESEAFLAATAYGVSPARMADREMVLRFLAFRMIDPADYARGDLDVFLRAAMTMINGLSQQDIARLSDEFYRSMHAAHAIFEDNAFRKRYPGQTWRLPINKALFEAVAVGLAKMTPRQIAMLVKRRDQVQERFMTLMDNAGFLQSISGGTGDVGKVRTRFASIEDMLREVAA